MLTESELPITSEGRIYHLNLLPDELADTVITVGDPARVKSVSRLFDSIEVKQAHREFITHTGHLNGRRISVISTGIGTPNIDIVLTELDALKNIDFSTRQIKASFSPLSIVRLGTTGGLQSAIEVGSLVVTQAAIGLDALMHYYQWGQTDGDKALENAFIEHMTMMPVRPYAVYSDDQLYNQFKGLGTGGLTATCPGFYGPQDRIVRAQPKIDKLAQQLTAFRYEQSKVLNFEMETAALLGMARALGHRCTSVATVVANRCTGQFSDDPDALVNEMIERSMACF